MNKHYSTSLLKTKKKKNDQDHQILKECLEIKFTFPVLLIISEASNKELEVKKYPELVVNENIFR